MLKTLNIIFNLHHSVKQKTVKQKTIKSLSIYNRGALVASHLVFHAISTKKFRAIPFPRKVQMSLPFLSKATAGIPVPLTLTPTSLPRGMPTAVTFPVLSPPIYLLQTFRRTPNQTPEASS